MLEGGLANLGFLGGSFQWWIGQICDDSTWRDNILPYKFEEAEQIPGWGYRYKVRILGLHPMSNDILPSEKLKFATVMYGVSDGGGQGGTFATPAIRPGNFVFGFFLDGNQEEVPIIMGILGNNAQTELQGKTELTGGKAGKGISGYAEQKDKPEETKITAGDNLSITKPKTKLAAQESGILSKLSSLSGVAQNLAPQLQGMAQNLTPQLQSLAQVESAAQEITSTFSGTASGSTSQTTSTAPSGGGSVSAPSGGGGGVSGGGSSGGGGGGGY